MRINPTIALTILFFAVAGCSQTREITISTLEPAAIELPASINRLTIMPVTGLPSQHGNFDSLRHIRLRIDNHSINEIKSGYLHGIYHAFRSSQRFQKVVLSKDTTLATRARNHALYSSDIAEACKNDSTQTALLLTRAVTYDIFQFSDLQKEVFTEDYYFINHTDWAFYNPEKEQVIRVYRGIDTIRVHGGYVIDEFRDHLYEACYLTGYHVGNLLAPHWKDAPRVYYSGPGRMMRKAHRKIVSYDDWHQAGLLWNKLAEASDSLVASHAAHNIALAYERDDVMDQSVLWLDFALAMDSGKLTVEYRKLLDKRIVARAKLDKQLNLTKTQQ